VRDELCMTDQISGEWFSHLVGLPGTPPHKNEDLSSAIDNIFRHNFNPEFGLPNAPAPRKSGNALLALNNLQVGGLWSGIEFAFASPLMDQGRFTDGVRIVEAIHRRYLRAGQPWNHVECGGHYSRAISSWATMLAASDFKPDMPHQCLEISPEISRDFHAPWVMASAYGTIWRAGGNLSVTCRSGRLELKRLRTEPSALSVWLDGHLLAPQTTNSIVGTEFEFKAPIVLAEDDTISITEPRVQDRAINGHEAPPQPRSQHLADRS
jgi:hypothetical protein